MLTAESLHENQEREKKYPTSSTKKATIKDNDIHALSA
jgi:hypothetical protein